MPCWGGCAEEDGHVAPLHVLTQQGSSPQLSPVGRDPGGRVGVFVGGDASCQRLSAGAGADLAAAGVSAGVCESATGNKSRPRQGGGAGGDDSEAGGRPVATGAARRRGATRAARRRAGGERAALGAVHAKAEVRRRRAAKAKPPPR